MGGNGTLFEVINGVVGLPNVQVAWYPLGNANSLLYSFGNRENFSAFQSLRNLTLSPVITIDTIRAGNHYMAINALIGVEAEAFRVGESIANKTKLSRNFCYIAAGLFNSFIIKTQSYNLEIDDVKLKDTFRSLLITNAPTYGAGLHPADGALFNDGYMDLYTMKIIPKRKLLQVIGDYEKGHYSKWPEYFSHYRCKKLRVTSASTMTIALDGDLFYDNAMDFEICPRSVDLVCPPGINVPSPSPAAESETTAPKLGEMINGIEVSQ
jgi:diacylglycerol kinase family enzyme